MTAEEEAVDRELMKQLISTMRVIGKLIEAASTGKGVFRFFMRLPKAERNTFLAMMEERGIAARRKTVHKLLDEERAKRGGKRPSVDRLFLLATADVLSKGWGNRKRKPLSQLLPWLKDMAKAWDLDSWWESVQNLNSALSRARHEQPIFNELREEAKRQFDELGTVPSDRSHQH